jgi:tetratricopeptide (TPR) repeat protein
MRRFLIGVLAAAAVASVAQEAPRVLIVQRLVPPDDKVDPNVLVRSFFVRELAEDGRLFPISYSAADSIYRAAIAAKTVDPPLDAPTLDQAFGAAAKLKCEYVFIVQALKHQTTVYANAELYKGRRQIWKDSAQTSAEAGSGFSLENAVASIARTWILGLGGGPLKGLAQKPMIRTPDPETVETPTQPAIPDPEVRTPTVSNEGLRAEVDRLLKAGDRRGAISACRLAIDAEPLDAERRKILLGILKQIRQFDEAEVEARRAALLFPQDADFRLASAECAIGSGRFDAALQDLTENLVRSPEDVETRRLLAEVCLFMGRTAHAQEHILAAMKGSDSAELLLRRSAVFAAIPKPGEMTADLAKAREGWGGLAPEKLQPAKDFVVRTCVLSADHLIVPLRDLLQLGRRDPKAPNLKSRMAEYESKLKTLVSWQTGTEFVGVSPQLLQRALLGLRLLEQTLAELVEHVANPAEGLVDEATITLGNAARAISQAKEEIAKP